MIYSLVKRTSRAVLISQLLGIFLAIPTGFIFGAENSSQWRWLYRDAPLISFIFPGLLYCIARFSHSGVAPTGERYVLDEIESEKDWQRLPLRLRVRWILLMSIGWYCFGLIGWVVGGYFYYVFNN